MKYRVAPADEYFGRLKLSILGIRNTIKDMGLKADADSSHAANVVMGSVGLTEDAIHDWEKKYPQDGWIASPVQPVCSSPSHPSPGAPADAPRP